MYRECYCCGGQARWDYRHQLWVRNWGTPYDLCCDCAYWLKNLDRRAKHRENKTIEQALRECYACGRKNMSPKYTIANKPTKLYLCKNCAEQTIYRVRRDEYNKKHPPTEYRHLIAQTRKKLPNKHYRTGVCNYCRAVKPFDTNETHFHHDEHKYDLSNPIRFTIELCSSCHGYENARLKKLGIEPTFYY